MITMMIAETTISSSSTPTTIPAITAPGNKQTQLFQITLCITLSLVCGLQGKWRRSARGSTVESLADHQSITQSWEITK